MAAALEYLHNIRCVKWVTGRAENSGRLACGGTVLQGLRTTPARLALAASARRGGVSIAHDGGQESLRLF